MNDTPAPAPSRRRGPVDMHVHVVGNGSSGSGCWLKISGWHWPLSLLMMREARVPTSALKGDLDGLFLQKLLEYVRGSSLEAVVILAQDYVYEESGRALTQAGLFYVPNDYVLDLAQKYPELLPAVSIHPGRPDALEELERCLARGAVMMKCLPNCQNINCNDRRYIPFWERMAQAGIPLLAHTGGEHTVPVVRPDYADPRVLELPLQCGVTVIAAHSATKSGLFDPEYFHVFAQMTRRYPNLYGDNSAFNVPIRGRHVAACLREPLRSRILHGSDFPVPVHGHWAWLRRQVSWRAFRTWEKQPNILERDYQLKRAMGFPEESFTKIWDLIPAPAPAAERTGQELPKHSAGERKVPGRQQR